MSCPATPEKPCLCHCHTIIVEDDFGDRPLYSCDECKDGQMLATPVAPIHKQLDEILPKEGACDIHETMDSCPIKEMKAQITHLINQKCIEELERLVIHHSIHSMDKAFHDTEIAFIQDRISILRGEL